MLRATLRTAYAVGDDLDEFAERWLASGAQLGEATELRQVDDAQVVVLHRDGRWQVELCCVRAGMLIPEHVHPDADTIEVGVAGAVRLAVNGTDPFAAVPDDRLAAFTRGRGIRIAATDLHGGRVLACGAVFLSIQRWKAKPASVLTNYRGAPIGPAHREELAQC